MAFFPNQVMPLTIKKSQGNSSYDVYYPIFCEDFNKHDEEIQAIEEFLGLGNNEVQLLRALDPTFSTTTINTNTLNNSNIIFNAPINQNLLNNISNITNQINIFLSQGIGCSSGVIHNSGKIIFPENAKNCLLVQELGKLDNSITVNSTNGFPDSGNLTILNDIYVNSFSNGLITGNIDASCAEWITYNGKTGTSFLNCQRAIFGTTSTEHNGSFIPPWELLLLNNFYQYCIPLIDNINICKRVSANGFNENLYLFSAFSVSGTLNYIKFIIENLAGKYSIIRSNCPNSYDEIISVANNLGISKFRANGSLYLYSQTGALNASGKLTWQEASDFVDALTGTVVLPMLNNQSLNTNIPIILVFRGLLNVSLSINSLTQADYCISNSVSVVQTADARLYSFTQEADQTLQGAISYGVTSVSSPINQTELGD